MRANRVQTAALAVALAALAGFAGVAPLRSLDPGGFHPDHDPGGGVWNPGGAPPLLGHAAAGIRRSFGRFVLGAQALYAVVPDLVGQGGAAAAFGEDDGGGLAATLLLGYAF